MQPCTHYHSIEKLSILNTIVINYRLRGGGPIEAPARKPNQNNYYATHGASRGTTTLPAVNRVRSQTFHGSDPATRQSVRSNPDQLHGGPRRANIGKFEVVSIGKADG